MKCYLVGGAVRDELLGLEPRERDWVVVGATEEEMLARGFRRLDLAFPVFLHPQTGDEYALARRERKVGPGYKGFVVETGPGVTLEEDLARRDLRVNAIARDRAGRLIDPYGGLDDLDRRLLRHITPAFTEDPVRLLRAARFSAKLGPWGFRIADSTLDLMKDMARAEELGSVYPERLRLELAKALDTDQPWRFFEALHRCGALEPLLPSLAAAWRQGGDRDMQALRRLLAAGGGSAERFALVMRDADEPVRAALAPDRKAHELATWLRLWPAARVAAADGGELLALIEGLRLTRAPERVAALGRLWSAEAPDSDAVARLQAALAAFHGVRAQDLAGTGLRGPALGRALRERRLAAIRRSLKVAA